MGGNGARLAYLAKKLAEYSGPRFKQVGSIDGVKVVEVLNQKARKFLLNHLDQTHIMLLIQAPARLSILPFMIKTAI